MTTALAGIKQDSVAVLVGHCSSGRLWSIINNKMMEILKLNKMGNGHCLKAIVNS